MKFVETCRNEDVAAHLSIFATVLPMNDREGVAKLQVWLGTDATDRLIAMLIYALHPPEMMAPYEQTRLFQQEPYLFVADVHEILQTFGRVGDLSDDANRGIVNQLHQFGFAERWTNCLKNQTNLFSLKNNSDDIARLIL